MERHPRSVSISSSKCDGPGSIRMGTPTLQEVPLERREQQRRKYGALLGSFNGEGVLRDGGHHVSFQAAPAARHGYMPPEAGRLDRPPAVGIPSLTSRLLSKIEALFKKMDLDCNGEVDREEARQFFRSFGKVSAAAMFSEVDEDSNDHITLEEFRQFWQQVRASGYSEADLLDELDMLMEGNSWVDYLDQRNVGSAD